MRLSLVGAEPARNESAPPSLGPLSHPDTSMAMLLADPFLPSVHVCSISIEEEKKPSNIPQVLQTLEVRGKKKKINPQRMVSFLIWLFLPSLLANLSSK